jgi:molybdopterin converting factor small subunit
MVTVSFTQNVQRHVDCPPCEVAGQNLREVLDAVFDGNPRARGYVLDEHGALRKHMIIFINGEQLRDRERLSDPVPDGGEVMIFQALSGGGG